MRAIHSRSAPRYQVQETCHPEHNPKRKRLRGIPGVARGAPVLPRSRALASGADSGMDPGAR